MKTTILKMMVLAMALTISISSCKKEDNDFEMGTSEDN
jgi:predicted small lipoprotein YifL